MIDSARPGLGALLWSDRLLRAALLVPLVTWGFALAARSGSEVVLTVAGVAAVFGLWRVRLLHRLATQAVLVRAQLGVDAKLRGPFQEDLRDLHVSFEHGGHRFAIARLVRENEGGAVRSTTATVAVWFVPHAPRWAALVDQRLLIVRLTAD